MSNQLLTTGQALAQGLVAEGVTTVFGIPGAHMYEFNDALFGVRDRIRFIHTRHEQGAGYMAYGYARASGRTGVFTVVPGPGLLNASAALCTAYAGNTPVLCVTGNIMSHLMGQGRGQLHELPDQLATMKSLVTWAGRINHPSQTPARLAEAFGAMRSGRGGPAVIEAPWDVMGQRGPIPPEQSLFPAAPLLDEAALDRAAEMIRAAQHPMIFIGHGAVDAGDQVLALAQRIGAPVVAHRSGKGIVPDDEPHAMTMVAGYDLWQQCDLLIGVGSRLELPFMRWKWAPKGLKTLRIDIDPLEAVRLKPDLFVLGDAGPTVAALTARLAPQLQGREQAFRAAKERAEASFATVQPQVAFLRAIRAALPRDGFLVEEISQMGFTARFAFPVYHPRGYVTSAYQENLGFGFNTALGVKVANPDKAVVSISGDGGFLFGMQELATAAQHGIGVVAVVFDNGAYGNVLRDQQTTYGGHIIGAELGNPDFVALGKSFGIASERADTPEALETALRRALASGAPALIAVKQTRGADGSPWPFLHPAPYA
jgi:acetolactate synthase I/II/III large subunit